MDSNVQVWVDWSVYCLASPLTNHGVTTTVGSPGVAMNFESDDPRVYNDWPGVGKEEVSFPNVDWSCYELLDDAFFINISSWVAKLSVLLS